jgi:hypothetical protein
MVHHTLTFESAAILSPLRADNKYTAPLSFVYVPPPHTQYDHTDGVWHIRFKYYIMVYRSVNTPPVKGCFEVQSLKQLQFYLFVYFVNSIEGKVNCS